MPESSVKITLGVELDKSDLEQQIKEFQEELKQYKLQVGIDTVSSDSSNLSTEEVGSSDASSPSSPPTAKINFDDVTNVVSGGVDSIKSMIDPLVGQIGDLVDFIKQAVSGIREDLQPIKDLAEIQKEGNKDLTKVTQDAIADIKNEVVGAVKEGVKEISDSTTNIIKSAADQISGDIREQLEKLINNQDNSTSAQPQEKVPLIGRPETVVAEPVNYSFISSRQNFDNQKQDQFDLKELVDAVKELFADIEGATKLFKNAAQKISETVLNLIPAVENALNPLKVLASNTKDALQELTNIAKSSLADLKSLLAQSVSENLATISQKINSFLTQYLKLVATQAQEINRQSTSLSQYKNPLMSESSGLDRQGLNLSTLLLDDIIDVDFKDVSNLVLKGIEENIAGLLPASSAPQIDFNDTLYRAPIMPDGFSDIQAVFDDVYKTILKIQQINIESNKKLGLVPSVKVDKNNDLSGSSGYNLQNNEVILSQNIAQGLTNGTVSRDAFIEIAHEIRHAIQTEFGNISAQDASQNIASNSTLLQNIYDLTDVSKKQQIDNQVVASSEKYNSSSSVSKLELDAELFAQSLADIIFQGKQAITPDLLSNIASKDISVLLDEFTATGTFIKQLQSDFVQQKINDSTAVKLAQEQQKNVVKDDSQNQKLRVLSSVDLKDLFQIDFNPPDFADNNLTPQVKPNPNDLTEQQNGLTRVLGTIKNAIEELIKIGLEISRNTLSSAQNSLTSQQDIVPSTLFRQSISGNQQNLSSQNNNLTSPLQTQGVAVNASTNVNPISPQQQAGSQLKLPLFDTLSEGLSGIADNITEGLAVPILTAVLSFGDSLAEVTGKIIPFADLTINTLNTLEPIQTRLKTIGGSEQGGQALFDFAESTAKNLNIPILSAVEGYSQLAAAAKGTRFEGEDLDQLFVGVSNAIAALGLTSEDASLIFLAFQQILSKGVVTAEELKGQISERLPGALQIFAKALGLSVQELNTALENGELNLAKLAKLGPALIQEFGAGAQSAAQSFTGSTNKIANKAFELQVSISTQFSGIVSFLASTIASALTSIVDFIDDVVTKSGVLLALIATLQIQAVTGIVAAAKSIGLTSVLFGLLKTSFLGLIPALAPIFATLLVQVISNNLSNALGIEIETSLSILQRFFVNLSGLAKDSFLEIAKIAQSVGKYTETVFDKTITKIKGAINTANEFSRLILRAPTVDTPTDQSKPLSKPAGDFDFKSIAKFGLEFSGLFLILLQVFNVIGGLLGKLGLSGSVLKTTVSGVKTLATGFLGLSKAMLTANLSIKSFQAFLKFITAGIIGSNLLIAAIAALGIFLVVNSDLFNSFSSSSEKAISSLERLNSSIDNITGKKVELAVKTNLDKKELRDSQFQNKGLDLTFGLGDRRFTTDDLIRQAQKLIDDRSYRRNLPLIPNTPTTQNDNLADTGNIAGLQSVLTSEVTRTSALNNVEQVVDLRQELIKEKKRVEDELVIELGLNTRNLDQEINKLRKDVESIENLKLNPLVARFSIDGGNSFEKVNRDRLRQLESQIAELEKQKEINQDGLIIEGTSIDVDTKAMEEELRLINKQLAKINTEDSVTSFIPSIPLSNSANLQTTGNPFIDQQRINALSENQDNNFTELTKRREEILADLAVIRQTSGLTREEVQSQIAELRRQRDNLVTQSVQGGGDRNIKSGGLNADINAIDRQIEILVKFEGQKEINDTREELDRINRDLKAFELFADNPAVFNNAFLQDDSLIKQMAVQQVELFPSINNDTINTQRLLENNAVTEIPLIREDITLQQSRNNRAIADLNTAIQNIDRSAPNAAESLSNLQKQLNSLEARNKSLTSLDLLLSTTESYARLGLGKAAIDANLLADALQSLTKELEGAKVQTTESAGFIAKPSLEGMLNLEQELLMQFGQQGRSLRQAQSERANIEATPQLSITEQDLGRFGYLSKEARADLEKLDKAIEETKNNLFELQNLKIDTMDDGIKATVSFEEWNTLTTQIESLSEQLQNLRKERDKILQDAAKLAPPIQVDPTFRQDRLSKIDNQIAEIQSRVNDLSEQYQAIQSAKLEIGGATAIARQLDSAIRESRLTQDQKFLGILPNFAYSRRLDALTGVRDRLEPALGTVNAFAGQQTQLDSISLQGLLGGLQSGDISTTQKTLEQFDIQGNRAFFNGQELEGTPEEVRSFIEAIRAASKALKDIQTVANSNRSGTRIQKALESNLGLAGGTEERNRLLGDYRDTATRLFMSGAFDQTQFDFLTAPGRNLAEVEKALGDISRQGGKTNFSAIVDTLAKQGVPAEERTRIIKDLTRIQDLVEGLKGTDPARSLLPSFGTLGEKEYNDTVNAINEISKFSFEAFQELSLASFTGDLKAFERDLVNINPGLLSNLDQLRQIQNELDAIGEKRLQIQDDLARNDLTIEQRNQLEKESTKLDEQFREKYRNKKVVGGDLGVTFQAVQDNNENINTFIKDIESSDLGDTAKQDLISSLEQSRDVYIKPLLEFFGQVEDLVALSADESMALAFKNISRSLKNLQDSSARIQDETNKILAASSLKFREISTSLETTPLTGLGVSGAGTSQDAVIFDAQVQLDVALAEENARKQVRDIAFQEFTRSQEEFQKARKAVGNSPVAQQEELATKREELTQITEQYAQAEQDYTQAIKASSEARIAFLEAEASAITRRNQLSALLEKALLKEKRLRGEVDDETFDTESATQEFQNISVELAAAEALFKAITSDVQKGLVPSVVEANRKLEELNIRIAELKNQKLDQQLELENAIRARANQLIDNQINLTSKYLDVAIAGYERLNAIGGNTIKQLDGLTSLGQSIQSLFSATSQRLQTSLGQQSNLIGQILQAREVLKSEDATPEERRKAQERDGDLRKLGQLQGVNISPNSSEAQVLAKQAEIEAKLAQAKIEALQKEQAIANALLKIELQRNKIAAEQAVKEAEINKLKQQQALFQAQANVQKAAVEAARTGDQTGLIMAQLDLQIAQSQLSTATEGVDLAKQNVLIQDAIAGLQLEQAGIDNANAKDNLIGELASNENLDLGKILSNINSLLNFTPSDRTSREVFRPFLPKPKQETFIPEITVSLEDVNGDVNAWLNANIEANKERREQAQQQNPEARAIEQSVFDVFGRPQQSNVSYTSGNVLGSLEEQFSALSDQTLGSRWGKLLAPTKDQILRFSAESMIQQGIDKGLVPPEFDPKALGLDPVTLLPILPEILADVNIPTTEDMQQGNATFEEVAAFSLETTNKTLENIYGIVDTIPDTFVQATEQLGQMLINDEFKPIEIINKSSGFGIADGIGVSALKDLLGNAGLFSPTSANLDSFSPTGFIGAKATPFGQTTFDSSQYPQQNSFKGFSQMSVAQPFGASDIPYYANQPFTVDNSTTSLIKPDLTSIASSFIPPVTPVSTSTPVSPDKPKDTEFVKYISPTVVPATVRPARVVTPRGSTKSSSDMFKLPSIPEPSVSLNNVVNPNIQVPRQEKTPFYFYRDIASEMSPQVDYSVPPGVQSLGQKHNYQPETKVQNISVNITNQIDANTQKDFFSKIARVQQEAIISAINNA